MVRNPKLYEPQTPSPVGVVVLGGALVAAALLTLSLNLRWIRSVFAGPQPVTAADLRGLDDPCTLDNHWVTLTFDHAVETGVGMEEVRGGTAAPQSRFLLVRVGDRWLVTEVPRDFAGNTVTGYLDVWTVPLRLRALDAIRRARPEYSAALLGYHMDAEYDYAFQCYCLLVIMGVFLAMGLFLGLGGAARLAGDRRAAENPR